MNSHFAIFWILSAGPISLYTVRDWCENSVKKGIYSVQWDTLLDNQSRFCELKMEVWQASEDVWTTRKSELVLLVFNVNVFVSVTSIARTDQW